MRQMAVNLAGVELKNPVMTASGTFGSGAEYGEMVDLNKLGAVVTKGVANVPWPGNPTPRIAEVYGGMINAIGLQNPGYDLFASRDIPFLRQYDTKIIVNVCGKTAEDYVDVVEKLASQPVDMLEINISCPNVKEGGIAFGQDPKAVEAITREVKRHAKQPIIMKLSPNVRRTVADQHHHRHEDRYQPENLCGSQPYRRSVRPGSETSGSSHGLPGGAGGQASDHRHGRYHECGRCDRIYSGRRKRGGSRYGEFP